MSRAQTNSLRVVRKALKLCQDRIAQNEQTIRQLADERDKWKRTAEARVDTMMMAERVKLANSLGQMMNTVSEAVKFIIGKDVL